MGTSSALTVALIAAFGQLLGRPLTKHEIAEMACFIERRKLGLAGGYQDQYASACGGFNYIEFGEGVTVFPQQYPRAVCNELLERLVLCYTGKTHVSAEQQQALLSNARALEFMEGMHLLKELAEKARDFLTRAIPGRLDGFGQLLHEGWLVKRGLSQRITTDAIDHLYAHALAHGALGGKLLGAGGGGFLLLFAEATARCRLVEALRVAGGEIVDFLFDASGVEAWVVSNGND
jgi:D-glycero-alpha-D-manno-heptose-7-phosphate kinase